MLILKFINLNNLLFWLNNKNHHLNLFPPWRNTALFWPWVYRQDNGCDLTEDASAEGIQAALAKLKEAASSSWLDLGGWVDGDEIRLKYGFCRGL